MEDEERKQKLKAGKEKLAKFQKKKHHKHVEVEQGGKNAVGLSVDDSNDASPPHLGGDLQSLSSLSEEDVSGTEEEEPDSRSLVVVKSQLRDKAERVAELEENLVGKQLALDKVIKENERLRLEIAESKEHDVQDANTMVVPALLQSAVSSSQISDSQSTVKSDDQSENSSAHQSLSAESRSEAGKQVYTMAEVQELVQLVQWLQLQLRQAGTTLQAQNDKQSATTEALHQAKMEILSLQENMITKDAVVTQLADKLTTISTEYRSLKASMTVENYQNVPNGQVENDSESEENIPDMAESSEILQISQLREELNIVKENGNLEKADLMKALTIVKESNEVTLNENEHLKLENERLNEKLKDVSIEKAATEDNYESVRQRLHDIMAEFETVKREHEILKQEKMKLSDQNLHLLNEMELFEKTNSDLALEIHDLKNEKLVKEEDLKQVNFELDKMKQLCESLETANSGMTLEIQELKSVEADTNRELTQVVSELTEIKKVKKNFEDITLDLRNQVESVKQENVSFQDDNESLNTEIKTLKSQCQTQVSQISDYQSQIEDYENKISEANEVVEENHSLRTQNDDLYNRINNQKDIIAALKAETESVICKNMQLLEQMQDLASREELSRQDIEISEGNKTALENEMKNLKELFALSQEENIKFRTTINLLNLEIESLKQEIENSSNECLKCKCKPKEITTNDLSSEIEVTEEYFSKDTASRSESSIQNFSETQDPDPFSELSAGQALLPHEEVFITATDHFIVEPVDSDIKTDSNIVCTGSNYNSPLDSDRDNIKVIVKLQKENEILKKELMRFQAGNIVRNAVRSAQVSMLSEYTHGVAGPGPVEENVQNPGQTSESPVTVVSDICHNDTAYQTFDTEGPEQSDHGAQEIIVLSERLSRLQKDYGRINEMFSKKEEECQMLRTKLDQVRDRSYNLSMNGENLAVTEQSGCLSAAEESHAHHIDNPKVSDLLGIDASGMEVNVHASSALQKAPALGIVTNPVEGTVDEHVFQDYAMSNLSSHENEDSDLRGLQDEIYILKRTLNCQSQEKNELVAILEKERNKLNFAISEREELEELVKKYKKDLDNQEVMTENMKQTISMLENRVQGLDSDNEKLDWYKNELELKLSSLEKENSDLKLEKSCLEVKEEQVRDEFNRVKERLEYLESSEQDIFEMREVLDSLQDEKENILKEYEQLQKILLIKENENKSHLCDTESLHAENLELTEQLKILKHENVKLTSELKEVTTDICEMKVSFENIKQQNIQLNGEIDGLVEENSTLKTKIQTFEEEIQNVNAENKKLQTFFPDIDCHNEQLRLLDQKCENLENQLQTVTRNNEKMVVEITDTENKLMLASSENEILLKKCDEMAAIIADMDDEKTDLLEKVEKIKLKLQEALEEKNAILQKKDNEIEALVEENSTLKTQVNIMKEDLNDVKEQEQFIQDSLSAKKLVESLEKENSELFKENEEYQKKVNALEHDLTELVEQIQLYDDTISEKADLATRLEQEISSLLEENSTLKTKNNILEQDLNEIIKSHCEKTPCNTAGLQQGSSEDLTAKLELESKYKSKLQKDVESLLIKNNEYLSKIRDLEDEKEKVKGELTVCQNVQLENEKYIESLENQNETLLKKNSVYKEEVVCLENFQQVKLKQIESLTSELQTCQLHLQAISDNRNHVRTQVEILSAEVDTRMTDRNNSESNVCRLDNKCSRLQKENAKAAAIVTTLESENVALKSENEKYSKFLENVQERIGKLDKIIDKNEELASRNDALSKKMDDMETQVEKVKKEKVELEKLLDELTNMLHDMQTKYEEVKSEMEATKKKCDKEIKQLQTQLQTMNDDVQELRNMLDIMENEVYDANEEKLILKENLQQHQHQYEEVVERKQKLEEMLNEKHQKDVHNKRTACELMANKPNVTENLNAKNFDDENLCEMCQNELKRSYVSTFTQTDILMAEIIARQGLDLDDLDICNDITDQSSCNSSTLHVRDVPYFDSDKDMDTKHNPFLKEMSDDSYMNACRFENDMHHSADMSDFHCQVNIQAVQNMTRLFRSKIEVMSYSPSEPSTDAFIESAQCQQVDSVKHSFVTGRKDNIQFAAKTIRTSEIPLSLDHAQIYNIPARNIAAEMTENEQFIAIIEENTDACSSSHHANISSASADSGMSSAVTGSEFTFDCQNFCSGKFNRNESDIKGAKRQNFRPEIACDIHCSASRQSESSYSVERLDISCQTDGFETEDFSNIEKELQEKYEAMYGELENKIEDKLKKKLDFREQKIKLQEEHYEQKVQQIEYDIEERYAQCFRMREAEIMLNTDIDRKLYQKEIDAVADRKIEKVRLEKDQQFVEMMQKVRSDLKMRHKAELSKLKEELCSTSDFGPGGDGNMVGSRQQNLIQKLNEENKDLATARDALLRRANSSSLQIQAFHEDLQKIMGEEQVVDVHGPATQSVPSWLDWEMSPELSFGSFSSSIEKKSLSGSLDPNAFCTNSDCLSVRMKYEQLFKRIKKFLSARRTDTSFSDTSTPRAEVSDIDRDDVDQDNKYHNENSETDRFIENTEPEIPMLKRLTSIHLEHSVRVPCCLSGSVTDFEGDTFLEEDIRDAKEVNKNIMEETIRESQKASCGKKSEDRTWSLERRNTDNQSKQREIEGHFSENESESETENVSEGSVLIDYDQFESFYSESGMRVTDKNVHPFDECKFAKSVLQRHMSESELTEYEPSFRNRCYSDSGISSDKMLEKSMIFKGDKADDISEGSFIQERKDNLEHDFSKVSGFETNTNEVFDVPSGNSPLKIIPVETVKTTVCHKERETKFEHDKFVAEVSLMAEKPPGSAESLVLGSLNNEKTIGKDRGDFIEERPVVRKKNGKQLMELNFKFQSYSLDNEELQETTEPKIIPVQKSDNLSNSHFENQDGDIENQLECCENSLSFNRLSICEEFRLASPEERQNLFITEDEKLDSGDVLGNIAMDPPPVSEERQSYENTVFDVLNSICPGTNPVRLGDMINPVIQNFENTAFDFSESQKHHHIPVLCSQIQSLEMEISTLKLENESLNEQCRETEKLHIAIAEQKEEIKNLLNENIENLDKLKKTTTLKESLEIQAQMLRKENESLQQVNLESFEQMEQMKIANEHYGVEFEKLKQIELDSKACLIVVSKLEEEKQALKYVVSDLKIAIEKLEEEKNQISQEKDKAVTGRNELEKNFGMQRKEMEAHIIESRAVKDSLEQKVFLIEQNTKLLDEEKQDLESQICRMRDRYKEKELEIKGLKENLLSLKQNIEVLTADLKTMQSERSLEKELLEVQIKTLREENAALHSKACELGSQIDQINSDTEALIKEFDTKVLENKNFDSEVQNLKSVIQELHVIVTDSDKTNSGLIDEIKKLEKENLSLKERNKLMENENIFVSKKLKECDEILQENQNELDQLKHSLTDKESEIEICKETISKYEGNIDFSEKQKSVFDVSITCDKSKSKSRFEKTDRSTETEHDSEYRTMLDLSHNSQEVKLLKIENDNLKLDLNKSKEINAENEWAINELASHVELLEKEKENLNSSVDSLTQKLEHLNDQYSKLLENINMKRYSSSSNVELQTENFEMLGKESHSNEQLQSSVEDLGIALKKTCDEKLQVEKQMQEKYNVIEEENKSLSQKLHTLEKEKLDLSVLIRYNRETFEKEKTELLDMYNDLKNEVDILIETKKYLEDELSTLKDLLESGIDLKDDDMSRELTVEDLVEMEELKKSLDHLKRDMKEKDHYVRKLEEHLLNLDRGLPNPSVAPKPKISSGEPVVSKAFLQKRLSFGRQAYSLDRPKHSPSSLVINEKHLYVGKLEDNDLDNLDHSIISETNSVETLDRSGKIPFRSSVRSDVESDSSVRVSYDTTDKLGSDPKADEDGHYGLELNQFELVDEISKLRKDFCETKAIYEQETALLTEALEHERAVTDSMKKKQTYLVDEKGDGSWLNNETTVHNDLVRARQDIALLRRENNILRIENERWLNRMKEQEQIILDLRERLARNTFESGELEDVFGRQLALLQKQREELLDQIRDLDQENSRLSVTLGEKAIIEDSLRREKEILSAKQQEKSNLEKELHDKQMELEKQKLLQKQFEEVVYQKDVNERNLMKQKRILEEELLEIESKFRDREENLGFEKNKLLDELREKHRKQKSEVTESQDDVRSVCSDSSVSEQQISRLELMLEEVEKQHKRAVKILRDQLQSKYERREKSLKEEQAGALKQLYMEHKKQVN